MDVLFELEDRLGREGVRDSLALARVLSAVAGVEQTAADRDKGVVVFAVGCQSCAYISMELFASSPLQHAIAVAVDDRNRICIRDTNVVWLNPDHLPKFLVRIVDGQVALSLTGLGEQP